jgi:MFS transporter, DHA2 family, multidrug resistance protein
MLIFFRVLQGAGGGGLQPVSQAILADTFPPVQLGMAFAVYGIAVVLAPAVGPTLGGYITDNFNWRWIFFINVPVGILSLALTSRLVRDPEYIKRKVREGGRLVLFALHCNTGRGNGPLSNSLRSVGAASQAASHGRAAS